MIARLAKLWRRLRGGRWSRNWGMWERCDSSCPYPHDEDYTR